MPYKILHLPTATYIQTYKHYKKPHLGNMDAIFTSKEDAEDFIRNFVIQDDVDDIDEPHFLFCHFSIEETSDTFNGILNPLYEIIEETIEKENAI